MLRVQDLSQSFVLKQALDVDHLEGAAVPLHPLGQLVSSKVFRRVWVQLGESLRRREQPRQPGDQRREAAEVKKEDEQDEEEEEPVLPGNPFVDSLDELDCDGSVDDNSATTATDVPLSLSVVVRDILPEALTYWADLVDRTSSGSISSREAWGWLEGCSYQQREEQIQLMFRAGIGIYRKSFRSSSSQVMEALEAHASIEWCLDAIPGLLNAHVVLHTASTAPGNTTAAGGGDGGTTATGMTNDPVPNDNNLSLGDSGASPGAPGDGETRTTDGDLPDKSSEAPLSRIFTTVPKADATRGELEFIAMDLSTRWGSLSLHDAADAWQKVREWGSNDAPDSGDRGHHIPNHKVDGGSVEGGRLDHRLGHAAAFPHPPGRLGLLGRSRVHVNMLHKLSESPALVRWLLEVCTTALFVLTGSARFR